MNQVEQLTAAKAVINTPDKWTQGTFAKTAKGAWASSSDPKAVCFCTLGAIEKVLDGRCFLEPILETLMEAIDPDEYNKLPEAMHSRADIVFNVGHSFNDSHNHSEVMAAFDRAISIAKERNL